MGGAAAKAPPRDQQRDKRGMRSRFRSRVWKIRSVQPPKITLHAAGGDAMIDRKKSA